MSTACTPWAGGTRSNCATASRPRTSGSRRPKRCRRATRAADILRSALMADEAVDGSGSGEHVWFRGNYQSWDEARRASVGYDAPAILEKVRVATLKVISGEAACERDSVAFDRV